MVNIYTRLPMPFLYFVLKLDMTLKLNAMAFWQHAPVYYLLSKYDITNNINILSLYDITLGGGGKVMSRTNRVNCEAVFGRFICSALRFISHQPRKRYSSLIFTTLPTKNLSNVLRATL